MIILTVRNIIPFFDIEGRKETVGTGEWGTLIFLQGMAATVNLIFVTQFYVHHDICMLNPFLMMCLIAVPGGATYALYTEEEFKTVPK